MEIKDIAQKLLTIREQGSSSFLMKGKLVDDLGPDGFSEALRRGWISADMEGTSGMLVMSNNAAKVAEIRSMAEAKGEDAEKEARKTAKGDHDRAKADLYDDGDKKKTDESAPARTASGIQESSSHRVALAHAHRERSIYEAAIGSGQDTRSIGGGDRNEREDADYSIGDDVIVSENGKTYQGKVKELDDDGNVKVSFGADGPGGEEKAYAKTQLGRPSEED